MGDDWLFPAAPVVSIDDAAPRVVVVEGTNIAGEHVREVLTLRGTEPVVTASSFRGFPVFGGDAAEASVRAMRRAEEARALAAGEVEPPPMKPIAIEVTEAAFVVRRGVFKGVTVRPVSRMGRPDEAAGEHVWLEGVEGYTQKPAPEGMHYDAPRFRCPMSNLNEAERAICRRVYNVSLAGTDTTGETRC